jgi:hypothetical protein
VCHGESGHRFVLHDHDMIHSPAVDRGVRATMGLRVLKTSIAMPQANGHCERLIGTARRECLDCLIPLNQRHRRRILAEWVAHLQWRSTTLATRPRHSRSVIDHRRPIARSPDSPRTSCHGKTDSRRSPSSVPPYRGRCLIFCGSQVSGLAPRADRVCARRPVVLCSHVTTPID